MPVLTVRNLPDEVHRALRARAAKHGRSMEAEVRDILNAAIAPGDRLKLGSLLADIGREAALSDDAVALFDEARDKTPASSANFE